MPTIRIVGYQVDALADELSRSLDRHSSFDGADPVIARILAGDHGVDTSLRGQNEIDVVLAQAIKRAIELGEARGRAEGGRRERHRIADLLGLS